MTFYFSKILFLFMLTNLFVFAEDIQKNREREAARSVIMRTVPSLAKAPEKLQLEIIEKEDGHDVFETKASGGTLNIRGSSGTALCRGFYDFLKTNHLGMVSWENKDIRWPAQLPDTALRLFGKPESFKKRRMGVAVASGADTDEARSRAKLAAGKVRPVAK